MILIVTEQTDVSSLIVGQYLSRMGMPYSFLYSDAFSEEYEIATLESDLKAYKGIWLRRGLHFIRNSNENQIFENQRKTLNDYLHFMFENTINCIGSLQSEYSHNKLIDLKVAESCNIRIPQTYIISRKQSLVNLLNENPTKTYITKSFKDSVRVKENDDLIYYGYTLRLMTNDIENLPITFYPSLVQEEIKKAYEVRVFYLNGKCYAMAIFSQNNEKTQLDYRYYDDQKANRNVPFQLDVDLEVKIDEFMQNKSLNCGSIDFMVDKNGEYYFLEVNPVGHFGWLSMNCNYYIEKEIANTLSQYKNE